MLPSTPTTFGQLFSISLRKYLPVLHKIILMILIMTVVKDAYLYLGGMPSNRILNYIIEIIIAVVVAYFVFASLYMTNCVLNQKKITFREAMVAVWTRALKAYLAVIIYIAIFIILLFIAYLLLHIIHSTSKREMLYQALIMLFIVGLPFLIFIIFSFFAIPLIIVDNVSVYVGFRQSIKLLGKQHWIKPFVLYLILVILSIIVDPSTRHGHFIAKYDANALFDFIVFCIVLPVYYSLLVLLINDLKLRKPSA